MNVFILLSVFLAFIMKTRSETFSTNLFYEIARSHPHENVIMSPSSVRSCLGLVYMGAGGETATELKSVLQVKGDDKDQVGLEFARYLNKTSDHHIEMRTANRIYLSMNYTIDDDYQKRLQKYFKSEAESVDFQDKQTTKIINTWVETQTDHKIKDLVNYESIHLASAVLVNAIYFNATWETSFEKSEKKLFHINKTTSVPVEMMSRMGKINYANLGDMNAQAIELPYAHSDLRMLVLLPNNVDGLPDLEEKIQNVDLTSIKLDDWPTKVSLPKFKIEFQDDLKERIESLGSKLIFDPAHGDLRGIFKERKNVNINAVVHKAFMEIDMKGTTAAAATAAVMARTGPRIFEADHPFFFAIKDAEHIYFTGHIVNFDKKIL